jgi:hypothetical protein
MKIRSCCIVFSLFAITILPSSFVTDRPSELAKLMKQMLVYIQQEKKQIEKNQPAHIFPATVQKVNKAKITVGKKLSNEHEKYVSDFFQKLNDYYSVKDSADRVVSFNLMVSSCVSCHKHECPGPIQVIEKNLFKE